MGNSRNGRALFLPDLKNLHHEGDRVILLKSAIAQSFAIPAALT
jgi:hypothetical protein